ncbi:MAG TPA: hypothetical protein DHV36_23825 [Desulfobacteraceae bacterium]|nr:hypothetical protein [Desulfobacteraceae bacterium]
MKYRHSFFLVPALVLISTVCTTQALAHKVIVFAWPEDGQVHIEAGFGGKRPAKNCEITASDSAGTPVYKGTTDDLGRHSFAIPEGYASDMTIVLKAGPGHKGSWTIAADEFMDSQEPSPQSDAPAPKNTAPKNNPLNQGTDPMKIIAGIAVIFGLAYVAKRFRAKKNTEQP